MAQKHNMRVLFVRDARQHVSVEADSCVCLKRTAPCQSVEAALRRPDTALRRAIKSTICRWDANWAR